MHRNVTSIIWSGLGKVGTKGVGFVFSLFLARVLCPDDFGLAGMISLFIALSMMFMDCGFSVALIRKTTRDETDFATVFWCQLVASAACSLALCLGAPLIAAFLGRPELVAITRTVSLTVVLAALGSVPYTRLRLEQRFRAISLVDTATAVLAGAIGLLLACRGWGVWAIVGQGIAWQVVRTGLLFAATRWCPACLFSGRSFCEFFAFGWRQLAASLINTVYTNLPSLLIGKVGGARATGLYNRAQYYTSEPAWLTIATFSEVGYPVLVATRQDRALYRRRFFQFVGAEALLMFLGLGTLALFAEPIVRLLVGAQWLPCVPYLRVLALGFAVEPLRSFAIQPLLVDGRVDLVLRLEMLEVGLGLAFLVLALPFGILALCWARTLYLLLAFAITVTVTWRRFI